ncbi:hypothetical protein [Nocardia sp. CY41]|uniref:hypothetical protein n=1 Tax=Nocardia sp. CY41 TaxID=2608686 RepID=UPI0013568AF1|nr:hypothetical protein [Nocardia sp. CY41]
MAPLNDPGHLLLGAVSSGEPFVPHGGGVLLGALGVSGATTPIVDHKIASAVARSG